MDDISHLGTSVSVIMPVFNGAAVIGRAVESILAQTHAAHEIILVDDGSTDGTRDVIMELVNANHSIKAILLEQNGGASRARNHGFDAATGDWVAIIDGDDSWRPNRLERMVALASEHNCDYVLDNMMLHDLEAGRDVRVMMVPSWDVLVVDQKTYWLNCRIGAPQFSILKMMVSKDFIDASGLRYDEKCGNGQDLIFHGEALALGARAVVTNEPMYVYSARVGDISKKKNKHSRTQMNFIGIADRIAALRARHAASMSAEVDMAARKCEGTFRVGHRLNVYRGERQVGQLGGWLKLALDPAGILLMLKMRYRQIITRMPRYAARA